MFNCSTKTKVYNVTEPSTCSYNIWLDTPMACFKGAMQGTMDMVDSTPLMNICLSYSIPGADTKAVRRVGQGRV